jgi:serine/threonine-protein kinase
MGGEDIGSYSIVKKIGEGGMGAVYLASHTLLGRPAAIKVLLPEMSRHPELVTRFFNEARAATSVKHPGIVEIYDFGYHTDGSAYIVMEFLDGESLATRLRRGGLLPEPRATALCRQIAGALGAAHTKGIVHRDLKPDNIFIVRDPDVADGERTKILDFGIAKLSTEAQGALKTRTGMVMGTPAYMSPEQCKGLGNVDHRTDLYALGCILHEMVCGRVPFVADSPGEVMAQHIYAPPSAPSSIAAVSPALEQVILRLIAKEPDHRFRSAEELIAALQAALPSGSFPHLPAATAATLVVGYPGGAATPPGSRPPMMATPPQGYPPVPGAGQTTMSAAAGVASTATAPPTSKARTWIPVVLVAGVVAGIGAIAAQRGDAKDPPQAATAGPPDPAPPLPPASAKSLEPPRPGSASLAAASPETALPSPAPPSPVQPATPQPPSRPATITIHLASTPSGADVFRPPQRVRIGTTPLALPIDAGPDNVMLVVKLRGHRDQTITLPADHDTDKTVTLVRLAGRRPEAASPAAAGTDFFSRTPPPAPPPSPVTPSGSIDPFAKPKK